MMVPGWMKTSNIQLWMVVGVYCSFNSYRVFLAALNRIRIRIYWPSMRIHTRNLVPVVPVRFRESTDNNWCALEWGTGPLTVSRAPWLGLLTSSGTWDHCCPLRCVFTSVGKCVCKRMVVKKTTFRGTCFYIYLYFLINIYKFIKLLIHVYRSRNQRRKEMWNKWLCWSADYEKVKLQRKVWKFRRGNFCTLFR